MYESFIRKIHAESDVSKHISDLINQGIPPENISFIKKREKF